jgi:hypothetical protein
LKDKASPVRQRGGRPFGEAAGAFPAVAGAAPFGSIIQTESSQESHKTPDVLCEQALKKIRRTDIEAAAPLSPH